MFRRPGSANASWCPGALRWLSYACADLFHLFLVWAVGAGRTVAACVFCRSGHGLFFAGCGFGRWRDGMRSCSRALGRSLPCLRRFRFSGGRRDPLRPAQLAFHGSGSATGSRGSPSMRNLRRSLMTKGLSLLLVGHCLALSRTLSFCLLGCGCGGMGCGGAAGVGQRQPALDGLAADEAEGQPLAVDGLGRNARQLANGLAFGR